MHGTGRWQQISTRPATDRLPSPCVSVALTMTVAREGTKGARKGSHASLEERAPSAKVAKRDFLDTLTTTIGQLDGAIEGDSQLTAAQKGKAPKPLASPGALPRSVTFGKHIKQRLFSKDDPIVKYEDYPEDSSDESRLLKEAPSAGAACSSSEEDDEEESEEDYDDEDESEEDYDDEEGPEFDSEGDDGSSGSEGGEDGSSGSDGEDDSDAYSDDSAEGGLDLDALSPEEQLKMLMAPVGRDEEDYSSDDGEEDGEEAASHSDDDGEYDPEEAFDDDGSDGEEAAPFGGKRKQLPLSMGREDDDDDEEDSDEEGGASKRQSTFERQRARMQKTIEALEEENISEKPWMLRGEVSARSRPANSLLEHDIDFEHAGKAAPIITEQVTGTLEQIIMQRIRDRAYDDVERKSASQLALMQERERAAAVKAARGEGAADAGDEGGAKKSLSQIYEEKFMDEKERASAPAGGAASSSRAVDPKVKGEHDAIAGLFTKICRKLDALSHFKFAPRAYPLADLQIESNPHVKKRKTT